MKEDVVKKNENAATDSKKRISKVKVALTLGHTASHRSNKSDDFTHDWSFYVRGDSGCKIQHYIDRVVFKLHESFHNPVQVIKKPPYEIREQGYGTFELKVEVNFKNKREPKQIEYKYDLVLPAVGVPPIKRCRKEILTFTNPNSEFMGKLLDGGGVLHHYDTHGNLLSDPATKPSTSESPVKAATPPARVGYTSPINKNKDHDSERKAGKEKKRKEKKVIEEEEEVPEQEVVKESKKQKKISKPPSAVSSNSDSKVERKSRAEEKQKQNMSSVIAAIGDVESSDEEKFVKDSSPRESGKQQLTSGTVKKVPPKLSAQKEKSKRKKHEEAFLEFDKMDALKVKKKHRTKSEQVSDPVSPESEKKRISLEKEEKPRPALKTSKLQKEIKLTSKKHSSSNSDEDNRVAKKVEDTLLEFDDISTIKTKKKHEKQHAKVESTENERRKNTMEAQIPISKVVKRRDKYKQLKEMKLDKPRKGSSSLSSDTEDDVEEDGEIITPLSPADEVARVQNMEPDDKDHPQDNQILQNKKHKERKNKHKAIKKDPEKAWKPSDFKPVEPADEKWLEIKKDVSKSSEDTPKQSESPITKHSSKDLAQSQHKAPEFHRAAPPHSFPKTEIKTPPTSSLDNRQRFSESSSDQENAVLKPNIYNTNSTQQQDVAVLSPDHLRFMLNIYSRIDQLQKTDDKNTITEVINILSAHSDSSMDIKDDNVTFDLVNCDLETLRSIDSVLS